MNKCNQDFNDISKPDWGDHDYAAICMCGNSNWFGLHKAEKPPYSNEWKGKEVHLIRGAADFLKYGQNNVDDIEVLYEVRPSTTNA